MVRPTTLYRFTIDVSDIDRGFYQLLDFRVAMHPSESFDYLVTRVLAFSLSFEDGLEFSPEGLSNPDLPCMRSLDSNGAVGTWIEIGNPSARKLHKASKTADHIKIFTYKDPRLLVDELNAQKIYKSDKIEIYSFDAKFLSCLSEALERNNQWTLLHQDGSIMVNCVNTTLNTEITRHILTQ